MYNIGIPHENLWLESNHMKHLPSVLKNELAYKVFKHILLQWMQMQMTLQFVNVFPVGNLKNVLHSVYMQYWKYENMQQNT